MDPPLSGVTLFTGPIDGNRTVGLAPDILSRLHQYCDDHSLPLLIEADGSRQLPLKAPAVHEPPIPAFADPVVVVAGLSGLGKPLSSDSVHRPKRFAELSGLTPGDEITPHALTKVLLHSSGGLKNIPKNARRIVLLNQAESLALQKIEAPFAAALLEQYHSVLFSSFRKDSPVLSVHEPVAGIILAAGGSTRFGSPKQLLDWNGKPLIWQVANTAARAGLAPIVVVTGDQMEAIKSALTDLPVEVVHNPDWATGQGTSVGTGIRSLPPEIGAALFLLADQPRIPDLILRTLRDAHSHSLSPIVGTKVEGIPRNPVLFDRVTFKALSDLKGDVGGRQLFSKFDSIWVEWDDEALFIDIDTPDDYLGLANE
jgi:molybdenum cofactor cytidylyltransferase